ncbi:MAG: helix-turn-helix transcriptional regulator [Anaerolineae bacterium]
MGNVATRLISLIMLLQTRSLWKAAELAEELNVSERTVHRYMGMLEEMGIPIYTERGPYGGFSLMRGYKLPPLIFTAEEATVLYMGTNLVEQVWGQMYHDAITSVTAKLDNVLPDDLRRQVEQAQQSLVVCGLASRDLRPWAQILQTLREAIKVRHTVRLVYRSFSLEETQRDVDPYALSFRWGNWYLVGFCHLREAMRTFRLDRIQAVERRHTTFTIPETFSAREYIERAMRFENRYTVVVHFDSGIAPYVREHTGDWVELQDCEDGSVVLRMAVSDLDWALGWVLSYGGAAQVLEPAELVRRAREEATRILARYQPPID